MKTAALPEAVIFDLDGTLLDTEPDFTFILNRMLSEHGRAAVDSDRVRRIVSFGAGALVGHSFGLNDDAEQLPGLQEQFLHLYDEQIPQTRASLFEDIDRLIAALHEDGLRWGIMTNKMRRFSEPLLQHFESFSTCGVLVCPDDVGAGKPDPAGILAACEQLGVAPERAVYVGDHPRDVEAARNAGMPGLAVRWGYLPEDSAIEHWGASHIADSPLLLSTYLREPRSDV